MVAKLLLLSPVLLLLFISVSVIIMSGHSLVAQHNQGGTRLFPLALALALREAATAGSSNRQAATQLLGVLVSSSSSSSLAPLSSTIINISSTRAASADESPPRVRLIQQASAQYSRSAPPVGRISAKRIGPSNGRRWNLE